MSSNPTELAVTLTAHKASGLSREGVGLILRFVGVIEHDYNLDREADRRTLSMSLKTQGIRVAQAIRQAVPSGTLEAIEAELARLRELDEWKSTNRAKGF